MSPVRDEAGRVEKTIASVIRQTLLPHQWVLVNDGSTDGTGAILDEAAREHSWITVVHGPNRGYRASGAGVVAAFRVGYAAVQPQDWRFLVKLDGDLVLPPDYFERCFEEFVLDPRLGIAGGTLYHLDGTREIVESNPVFHVRGATKIYRRACWDAIGGLVEAPGWDTIDEVRAQQLGWTTRTFPHVRALHLRPTGLADGAWRTGVKDGRGAYAVGYHPLFLFLRALRRAAQPPYGLRGAALIWGYLAAYLERGPRADADLVRFVRKQQARRLLGLSTIWR